MSDKATAENLFRDLGPLLDPAAIVYDEAESRWAVVIDQTTRIDVGYGDGAEQLVFALDLGPVPDQTADQVHELLLRFSYVWRETGGLYGALDAEGRATLMYTCAVQGLDVQRLQTLLRNLLDHRRLWADLIARSETDAIAGAAIDGPAPFGAIKV